MPLHPSRPLWLFIIAFAATHYAAFAQTVSSGGPAPVAAASPLPSPNLPALPTDPAEILALAHAYNGLGSPDFPPWHIKATYEIFDESGKSKEKGAFEEYWAAPKEYKRTFASPSFHQTEYETTQGEYLVGDQTSLPFIERMVGHLLEDPVPANRPDSKLIPVLRKQKAGTVDLVCVMLAPKLAGANGVPLTDYTSYCFSDNHPMLRIALPSFGRQIVFNHILLFQGHFIAQDIVVNTTTHPLLKLHVESIGLAASSSPSAFAPPADALLTQAHAQVPGSVLSGTILKQQRPVFPQGDKRARISGAVVLGAVISREGAIKSLQILTAPDASLAAAATDAVKHWQYKPYLLNGQPVEVETEINVIFNFAP